MASDGSADLWLRQQVCDVAGSSDSDEDASGDSPATECSDMWLRKHVRKVCVLVKGDRVRPAGVLASEIAVWAQLLPGESHTEAAKAALAMIQTADPDTEGGEAETPGSRGEVAGKIIGDAHALVMQIQRSMRRVRRFMTTCAAGGGARAVLGGTVLALASAQMATEAGAMGGSPRQAGGSFGALIGRGTVAGWRHAPSKGAGAALEEEEAVEESPTFPSTLLHSPASGSVVSKRAQLHSRLHEEPCPQEDGIEPARRERLRTGHPVGVSDSEWISAATLSAAACAVAAVWAVADLEWRIQLVLLAVACAASAFRGGAGLLASPAAAAAWLWVRWGDGMWTAVRWDASRLVGAAPNRAAMGAAALIVVGSAAASGAGVVAALTSQCRSCRRAFHPTGCMGAIATHMLLVAGAGCGLLAGLHGLTPRADCELHTSLLASPADDSVAVSSFLGVHGVMKPAFEGLGLALELVGQSPSALVEADWACSDAQPALWAQMTAAAAVMTTLVCLCGLLGGRTDLEHLPQAAAAPLAGVAVAVGVAWWLLGREQSCMLTSGCLPLVVLSGSVTGGNSAAPVTISANDGFAVVAYALALTAASVRVAGWRYLKGSEVGQTAASVLASVLEGGSAAFAALLVVGGMWRWHGFSGRGAAIAGAIDAAWGVAVVVSTIAIRCVGAAFAGQTV